MAPSTTVTSTRSDQLDAGEPTVATTGSNSALHLAQTRSAVLALEVHGGYAAAFRVTSMFASRHYDVRRLSIDTNADGTATRIYAQLRLAGGQQELLRARLERLPSVLTGTVTVTQVTSRTCQREP